MLAVTYVEIDVPSFVDPNSAAKKVVLHLNGADASTTFTDEALSPKVWTAAGNAQLDTAQKKFGTASLLLDGAGDYISTPDHADFNLGAQDWTIDCWFNCVALTTAGGNIAGQEDNAITPSLTSFHFGRAATDEIQIVVSNGSVMTTLVGTSKFSNLLNTGWHHVAAVRSGNVLKLFVDGVQEGGDAAFTGTVPNSTEAFTIGARSTGGGSIWNGWLDEFRLTVGVALWTADFTPPAQEADIGESVETFRFAIATDYLSPDIDCIPSIDSVSFTPALVSLGKDLGQRAKIVVNLSDHRHIFNGEPYSQGTFWGKWRGRYGTTLRGCPLRVIRGQVGQSLEAMDIRHYVIDATGGPDAATGKYSIEAKDVLKFADQDRSQAPALSNGSLAGSISNSATAATLSPSGIGDIEYPTTGYLSLGGKEVVSFVRTGGLDANVVLLLHCDGGDGSTTFTDSSLNPKTQTAVGNAQVDTAQSKFGGASMLLDGTGDWVTTPDNADFNLGSSDFTVDLWFNCNKAGGSDADLGGQTDGIGAPWSNTSYFIDRGSANAMRFFVSDGTNLTAIQGTTQFTNALNTGWHHLAAVRDGNTMRLFIDGVQEASGAFTGTLPNATALHTIGARASTGGSPWVGWIDEWRITRGVARWTENFTPPTTAYRDGDLLDITRAQFGSTAAAHDAGDRAQLVLRYSGDDPADIIYDLLTEYAGVNPDYINLDEWQDETARHLGVIYARTICEPTSVNKLVAEMIEQAALALYWDDRAQKVRLSVLREIATDTDTFDEDRIIKGSMRVQEQPGERISQIWTYYGTRDPTDAGAEEDNYRAALADVALDKEAEYGSAEIRKIMGTWIETESAALRLNAIQLSRFQDPPRNFRFSLMAGELVSLVQGYAIEWWANQDAQGNRVPALIQVTQISIFSDRVEVEAEEMLASGGLPSLVNIVFLTTVGSVLSWTVPATWNDADNTVEVIGGGGAGDNAGGGGGAYSAQTNLNLTPGGSVSYRVGSGGLTAGDDGSDTWFNGASFGASSVGAKAGTGGIGNNTGGTGGQASAGIGSVKFSGGDGGSGAAGAGSEGGGGGGGAAGPHGDGADGGFVDGSGSDHGAGGGGADDGFAGENSNVDEAGAGGNNRFDFGGGPVGESGDEGGGGGGGPNGGDAGPGGAGEQIWTQTVAPITSAGPGGGGGGGGDNGNGGDGGLYGGGGGGLGSGPTAGRGAQGLIVISWRP